MAFGVNWLFRNVGARQDHGGLRVLETVFSRTQPVMVTDARARIQRVNPALCSLMGYEEVEILGRTPRLFRSDHHDQAFYDRMLQSIQATGHWEGEIWDRRKGGEVFPKWLSIAVVRNEKDEVQNMVACYTDLSERHQAREQINRLAFYDVLTGLPNRVLLRERLQQVSVECSDSGRYGALLVLDWDDFKSLNDSYGYLVGDAFLKLHGERIVSSLAGGTFVARLGGDEFAIVLPAVGENSLDPLPSASAAHAAAKAESVAAQLLTSLALSGRVGDVEYQGSASAGVVLLGDSAEDADVLLKQAEMAMYEAKRSGRGRIHFFDPVLERGVAERLQTEGELRRAIAGHELRLHYQPQVRVSEGGEFAVTGAEALVRWQHPTRGLLGPGLFVPVAEEADLISSLGSWVLREACTQLGKWRCHAERSQWIVAVNVSAKQFLEPLFVEEVLGLLGESGAPAERLKLELTESLLVDRPDAIIAVMTRLRGHGVRFSLDDFGTGYSSLSYLKRLPLNQLKIDQSFVSGLASDANDAAIAQSITALARGLGLSVIAEGVETAVQQRMLHAMGCDHYQGYWFSRPIPVDEFEAWSEEWLTQAHQREDREDADPVGAAIAFGVAALGTLADPLALECTTPESAEPVGGDFIPLEIAR